MTVTGIEPCAGKNGKVNISLNNQFAFVLYKGELSKYGINEGTELSDVLYEQICNEVLIPRAKKRGLYLLQRMDRTEADVRQKLSENGYPDEVIEVAIEYIKSYHYIDDLRYASDYIHFKSSTMSRKQIVQKLIAKGISKDTIEKAFLDTCDNCESEETSLIEKLIIKRLKGNLSEIDYNERQKLFAYLYNKGFDISLIEKTYNRMISDVE